MAFSEEEVKRAAALKLWLEERVRELGEEQERLRETLQVLEAVLRSTAFTRASQLAAKPGSQGAEVPSTPAEFEEVIPLRRAKDGALLANAYVSARSVAIVPETQVTLNSSTPPFKSFYLGRILGGMRARDEELQRAGKLSPDEVMSQVVEEEEGVIKRIIINNYRDKSRLNEIVKSGAWVLSRMLERVVTERTR